MEDLRKTLADWCKSDLYFLIRYGMDRKFFEHQWFLDRCREVEQSPDGHLDLWSREHGKSTIITIGKTIQDILRDPEITVGIFSHTRPIAKSFLRVIKREFESNARLKEWFPEVLWDNPQSQAPQWSEDGGIIVKRKGNPPEATVEASGLVDGMPTGRHYQLRVYDDVVTKDSVNTPEQIAKTTDAMDMSQNLGKLGGTFRMIGTRYALGDTYDTYIKRGIVKPRIYPATDDGTVDGNLVYFTQQVWADKINSMSPAILASQMLQNPRATDSTIFDVEYIKFWPADKALPDFDAIYMSVDGAFSERTSADYSCILVVGVFQIEQTSSHQVMVLDCTLERLAYPDLRDECIRQYQSKFGANDKAVDAIIIEDKQSGSALIPDLRRGGMYTVPYNPGSLDKIGRAHMTSQYIRNGNLWMPESKKNKGKPMSWLNQMWEQLEYFPNVVDALTQSLIALNKRGFLKGNSAPERQATYWQKQMKGNYSGN